MKTRDEKEILMQRIIVLKKRQELEFEMLTAQFHIAYESLKPLNLIKSTFSDVFTSPNVKQNLLQGAVQLTTSYLTRNSVLGAFSTPIQNIVGNSLKFIISKFSKKKNSYQDIE